MTLLKAVSVLLLFSMLALPAAAQDLEVFEGETFLDPSALTVPGEDGQPVDLAFVATILRAGISQHFQFRSQYLQSQIGYLDATTTFVRGRLQITGRWTGLDYSQSETRNVDRAEAQIGYYVITPPTQGQTAPWVNRFQLSLSRGTPASSNPLGGTTLGVDWDTSFSPIDVVGGLSYAYYRPDRKCSNDCRQAISEATHFLSFDVRTQIWKPRERFGLDLGFGTGISYSQGQTRWDTFRGEIRLKWRTPKEHLSIYGVYAPAYRLDGAIGGPRINQEVSLFLQVKAWSALLPRLP